MTAFDRNALRAIGALRMIARTHTVGDVLDMASEQQGIAQRALKVIGGPPAHIQFFSTDEKETL